MLFQDLSAKRINFAEGNGFKATCSLQSQREAPNPGKKIKNLHSLAASNPNLGGTASFSGNTRPSVVHLNQLFPVSDSFPRKVTGEPHEHSGRVIGLHDLPLCLMPGPSSHSWKHP